MEIVKIYKIESSNFINVYVGSTIQKLEKRLQTHKCHLKRYVEGKNVHYCRSFDILAFGNYKIEWLETCSKKDRSERERYWVENTENTVNKQLPGRTKAEWYQEHKEYGIEYRKNNENKIKEKFDCECGGRYSHQDKSRHIKRKIHTNWLQTTLSI